MLTREEREDLLDPGYQESLKRDFEALRAWDRGRPRPPVDLATLLDWLTFMTELFEDRRPRAPFHSSGRMLL